VSSLPIPSRKFLDELGVRPSKGRGQNFLKEAWVVERMAGELAVGEATLSSKSGRVGRADRRAPATGADVTAIEIDEQLVAYLQRELASDRLTLVQADAPPSRSTRSLLQGENMISRPISPIPPLRSSCSFPRIGASTRTGHCMVQREVALRMAAAPPDLSLLGVAVQVYAEASLLFDVPPEAFVPKPKVVSSVVLLETRSAPAIEAGERAAFFRLVTAGFAQKRKTVLNSLAAALPADRTVIRSTLEEVGIDPMRRAETLSVDDWVRLLHALPVT